METCGWGMGQGQAKEEEAWVSPEPRPQRNPRPGPPPNPNPPPPPIRPTAGFISTPVRTQLTVPSHMVAPKSQNPSTPHPTQKPPHPLRAHTAPSRPPPPPAPKPTTPTTQVGDDPEDPIIGTVAHVPYPRGLEMGAVRGVHRNKGGVVWVQYPGNTTLYEVARGLLLPSPEEAETYQREARGGGGRRRQRPPLSPLTPRLTPSLTNPTQPPQKPPNPIDKENPWYTLVNPNSF